MESRCPGTKVQHDSLKAEKIVTFGADAINERIKKMFPDLRTGLMRDSRALNCSSPATSLGIIQDMPEMGAITTWRVLPSGTVILSRTSETRERETKSRRPPEAKLDPLLLLPQTRRITGFETSCANSVGRPFCHVWQQECENGINCRRS